MLLLVLVPLVLVDLIADLLLKAGPLAGGTMFFLARGSVAISLAILLHVQAEIGCTLGTASGDGSKIGGLGWFTLGYSVGIIICSTLGDWVSLIDFCIWGTFVSTLGG